MKDCNLERKFKAPRLIGFNEKEGTLPMRKLGTANAIDLKSSPLLTAYQSGLNFVLSLICKSTKLSSPNQLQI